MSKPALLIIDDDTETRSRLEESLQREYGDRFRVLQARSGSTALETLEALKQHDEAVALLLVSAQMKMSGVNFFEQAVELFPHTKRVLYTGDAEADIVPETGEIRVHARLSKPWHEPEVCLYPVLEDLLEDREKTVRLPAEEVQIVCQRWSPKAHEIRDFLARNRVSYQFLDVETDEAARRLIERADAADERFPLVVFSDGSHLAAPSNREIAEKIGLSTEAGSAFYDLVIIGGGPAGLSAAVYGTSEGLRTVVVERKAPGGQAGLSSRIENYPGFPGGLSGDHLAQRMVEQAKRFGAEILVTEGASGLRAQQPYRVVTLEDGTELCCHAVLIATGVTYRELDIPGADRLTGKGVYYGAARAEAFAYRNEEICLLGGGNSAGQAAVLFSKYARTVTILTIEASLAGSMAQYLEERIQSIENIRVRPRSTVVAVEGDEKLEVVTVKNTETDDEETVPTSGLFVFIGGKPHSDWIADSVARSEEGFILSGADLKHDKDRSGSWPLDREPFLFETSIPGVFVAGDVRHGSVKRITSAVGEGSMAIQFIHQYLSGG